MDVRGLNGQLHVPEASVQRCQFTAERLHFRRRLMDFVNEFGEAFDDSDGNRADGADTRYHRQGIRHLEYNERLLCP